MTQMIHVTDGPDPTDPGQGRLVHVFGKFFFPQQFGKKSIDLHIYLVGGFKHV